MDFLRAIANDLLNGFSANDIPVFLARIFLAGLVALVVKLIFKKKYTPETTGIINHVVLLAIVISIVVPVAQFSISLGLIMAALIIAFISSIKTNDSKEVVYTLIALLLASSIGAGYVAYSIIGAVVVIAYSLISKD